MRDVSQPARKRGWKSALMALGLFGVALLIYHQEPGLKGALAGGALLLLAWRIAFIGGPSLNVTLGQIYRQNRAGSFNWPLAGKACDLAAGALLLASFLV